MSERLDLDKIFMAVLDHYGEDVDSSTIPEPCGVLLLVYHTHGILNNGGFQYLLEGNYNDDPGFRRTRDAYRKIDAVTAVEAFQRVFSLFPDEVLPDDIDERLSILTDSFSTEDTFEEQETPDSQYWHSEDETINRLDAYVRNNLDAFPDRP